MAVLQQLVNNSQGLVFRLGEVATVVGRDDNCDLTIPSPAVSRIHARILREQTRFFLEDLKSRNGTSLNGRRIATKEMLHDGDVVDFSSNRFVFYSQTSLDEGTGQWGSQDGLVRLAEFESDASISHAPVKAGDTIPACDQDVHKSRINASIRVSGEHLHSLIAADTSRKLHQTLQLLHALRGKSTVRETVAAGLDKLFLFFPAAQRIAMIQGEQGTADHRVLAAAGRSVGDVIHLCYPLIRQTMHFSEALLCVDLWRHDSDHVPRLSELSTRHVLVVPLTAADNSVIGAIQMDSDAGERTPDHADLERLAVLAQVLSFALEQVDQVEQATAAAAANQMAARDSGTREFQLPTEPPRVPGLLIRHNVISADADSPNMVDYVSLSGGRIAVVLTDIPGANTDQVVSLRSFLSQLMTGVLQESESAAQALQNVQIQLAGSNRKLPSKSSVAIVIFDPHRGSALISAAGEFTVVTKRGNELHQSDLDEYAGPTFDLARESYPEIEVLLQRSDTLLIFSAAVARMVSRDGAPPERPLLSELIRRAAASPEQFESGLRDRIRQSHPDGTKAEDLAFVVISRFASDDMVVADFDADRPVPKVES